MLKDSTNAQETCVIHRSMIVIAGCLVAACATVDADTQGLVKDKPASGPFVHTDRGFMVPYTQTIPGTDISFEMIPIPGGKFMMGSPDSEADREDDEGPQFEVVVEPFWMGKHEVTWAQYKHFMEMYTRFKKLQELNRRLVTDSNRADAVTIPTPLYDPSKTYERGEAPDDPAVTMSPYGARQFTKWLSLLTDRFYRLPSEAEWEYAARAGTGTAYSFGDDPEDLDDYAWYFENSLNEEVDLETYHTVGSKKPNPWGLYDMHGNVSELVLDEYRDDHYEQFEGKSVRWIDAIAWPTKRGPRVHRGGSWDSDPDRVRSAARGQTDEKEWKIQDPNTPKSPWWYTEEEARSVGMRIIRPLHEPSSREDRNRFWEEFAADVTGDISVRLEQGRAVLGIVDPQLPAVLKEIADE
jgi:formylglycine-generating enzyme